MQLSQHFSLSELTVTDTGLDNTPPHDIIPRLVLLAAFAEKLRHVCGGLPMTVNSAYRDRAVNVAVGGVPNSAHALGFALDFTIAGQTPFETASLVDAAAKRGEIVFDQLILEQLPVLTWTHCARRHARETDAPRMQRLTKAADGGYISGLSR